MSTPSPRNVTIRNVARLAGVSVATVSRVINGAENVGESIRNKVELAMGELQFLPNAQARALASREFRTVAAIIPTVRNVNFVLFIRALQETLSREGYTLLVSAHDYDERLERHEAEALLARGLDGVVLVGQEHDPSLLAALDSRAIPYVTTWTLTSEKHVDCVGVSNAASAARLTRYLLDLGHRDFVIVASLPPTNDRNRERIEGVRQELVKAGISLGADRILDGTGTIEEGKAAMQRLAQWSPRPTAVICVNDFLAFGALLQCQALGIRVPEDMSIAGFGDIQFAPELTPALTTVRMPAAEIGRLAGENLLRRFRAPRTAACAARRIRLEAPLVVRASTGPCPKAA